MRTFAADKVLFDIYRWVGARYILVKVTKSRHNWHQYIATAICVRSTYTREGTYKNFIQRKSAVALILPDR